MIYLIGYDNWIKLIVEENRRKKEWTVLFPFSHLSEWGAINLFWGFSLIPSELVNVSRLFVQGYSCYCQRFQNEEVIVCNNPTDAGDLIEEAWILINDSESVICPPHTKYVLAGRVTSVCVTRMKCVFAGHLVLLKMFLLKWSGSWILLLFDTWRGFCKKMGVVVVRNYSGGRGPVCDEVACSWRG